MRCECTDRLLIINGRHLRHVLDACIEHHSAHRSHQSQGMNYEHPTTART
ncbi:hypothetical protein [Actinokineospora inagensis]|nr:hypothetical protein [Actinokineospora inagensis]